MTRRLSKVTRMQPFFQFGLNDDATDVLVGLLFTKDVQSKTMR